jgi:cytochrome c biogenesis protein CcdA
LSLLFRALNHRKKLVGLIFAHKQKNITVTLHVSEAMDLAPILILLTGFALGLGHSLDPDHVVAVSTLLCNNMSLRKSILSATAWGTGHSIVLFLVGLLVLTLRVVIPESVVVLFEFAAGVLLVILGALVVKPLIAERIHTHRHSNQEDTHTHLDAHLTNSSKEQTHLLRSAITGVLQGLGGSAALMLVTLTTVSSVELGLVFILVFGAGVVLGMAGIACLVSSLLAYTASHLERVHKAIKAATGSASIILGVFIIAQVVFQL